MTARSKPLRQKILEHARELPEGTPLLAGGLLHLGNRARIRRVLSRLAKCGDLFRVGRGIYVLPIYSRWGKATPYPYQTVTALAEQRGESVVFHSASAANVLGLTTQNPMQEIYLTSGRSRTLYFGRQEVELRHAPDWQLALGESKAGKALRALEWYGPDSKDVAVKQLRRVLSKKDRKKLASVSTPMPAWVSAAVREISHG